PRRPPPPRSTRRPPRRACRPDRWRPSLSSPSAGPSTCTSSSPAGSGPAAAPPPRPPRPAEPFARSGRPGREAVLGERGDVDLVEAGDEQVGPGRGEQLAIAGPGDGERRHAAGLRRPHPAHRVLHHEAVLRGPAGGAAGD